MLIVMERDCSAELIQKAMEKIDGMGLSAHLISKENCPVIAVTGTTGPIDPGALGCLPGVAEVIPIGRAGGLVSREANPGGTLVKVGPVEIGGAGLVVIAGPCAVETEKQTIETALAVRDAGAHIFRGGAYKPRSSPYSFQGLGLEGLRILARARKESGLPVVTEAVDEESLAMVEEYADMVQIGARNMQNFQLLKRAGRCRRPVFLKRGLSATLDELLLAAEYILSEGNRQVVLCERGVRTFANHSRNTLDLALIPAVRTRSHLPIFVDPSHGTGMRSKVAPLARAAVAVGADGVMIEVHPSPENALSDGAQALLPWMFRDLMKDLSRLAPLMGRAMELSTRPDGSAARA